MTRLSVILPAKRLVLAKSRLAVPDNLRRALALAFLADTVATALSCRQVSQVLVVTCDAEIAAATAALGADILRESEPMGLNVAIDRGREHLDSTRPASSVGVLVGDLPALDLADLEDAITQFMTRNRPLLVADHGGSGTTFVAHRGGTSPAVSFGRGSAHRHAQGGFVPAEGTLASLRLDIDTLTDLEAALSLNDRGPRTRRLVEGLTAWPSRTPQQTMPSCSQGAAP